MPPKAGNKVNILNDIDNTIHHICNCIINENKNNIHSIIEFADITKALAELVSARASLDRY